MTETQKSGTVPYAYWEIEKQNVEIVKGGVIEEILVSIYVNGQELATIMCTPFDQEALAIGFLHNEGIINSIDEIGYIQANVPRTTVDVFLTRSEFEQPRRLIITSGCGGGVTLQRLTKSYPALESSFTTVPDIIFERMRDLQSKAHLYRLVRGVHTSILGTKQKLLLSAEDVGRHNTIDKLAGKALQESIQTHECMLFTSGRISSEMLTKARRMNIPLVASRTSPTSIAVDLAQAWNICLVGYVRRDRMRIYTHPQRLGIQA